VKLAWDQPEMLPVKREFQAIVAGFVLSPIVGIIAMAVILRRTSDPARRRAQLSWIGIFTGLIALLIVFTLLV
jgi:hypothetical protein